MSLNLLLQQVKEAVVNETEQQNQQAGKFDPAALLAKIEVLFQQHQQPFVPQESEQPHGLDPYGGLPDEAGPFEQGDRIGDRKHK